MGYRRALIGLSRNIAPNDDLGVQGLSPWTELDSAIPRAGPTPHRTLIRMQCSHTIVDCFLHPGYPDLKASRRVFERFRESNGEFLRRSLSRARSSQDSQTRLRCLLIHRTSSLDTEPLLGWWHKHSNRNFRRRIRAMRSHCASAMEEDYDHA